MLLNTGPIPRHPCGNLRTAKVSTEYFDTMVAKRERERQNRKTKQQQAQLRERVGRVAVPDRGASEYTR